jgi:alanine racemase
MSAPQRATARIDLDAIRHNAGVLAAAAGAAELMAVVKANGYGHGAVPVARAALQGGARSLAVATVEEADELWAAGLDVPMLIMGSLVGGEVPRALGVGAEVAVWTPEMCVALASAAAPHRPARVHIGLDTGMGRLGVRPEGLPAVVDAVSRPGIEVVGIMTHFATADALDGDDAGFFSEQLLRFKAATAGLRDRFPQARLHAANSAATLRGRDAAFDLVRCGIALYGCSPFDRRREDDDLRPAMRWSSYVAVTKWLNSRESAGYGRTWRAPRGTTIAVVPVGYADGYARSLSNRGFALVGERRVPVVGTISMDQLTIDLGPEAGDSVGDEVVLLGRQGDQEISAEEMAGWRDTISYEVTCGVGARVRRVHAG